MAGAHNLVILYFTQEKINFDWHGKLFFKHFWLACFKYWKWFQPWGDLPWSNLTFCWEKSWDGLSLFRDIWITWMELIFRATKVKEECFHLIVLYVHTSHWCHKNSLIDIKPVYSHLATTSLALKTDNQVKSLYITSKGLQINEVEAEILFEIHWQIWS